MRTNIRIVVFGGRLFGRPRTAFTDAERAAEQARAREEKGRALLELSRIHRLRTIRAVISGMAPGADNIGVEWAKTYEIPLEAFYADWDRYGKSAGFRRNRQMRDAGPDVGIGFPGGRGTADMARLLREVNIPVYFPFGEVHTLPPLVLV